MKKPTNIKDIESNLDYQSSYLKKLKKRVNPDRLVQLVERISDESDEIVHEACLDFRRSERLAGVLGRLLG